VGEERQGAPSTPPGRKLAVSEAAKVLGISAEAVRSRIKRGTMPSVKEGSTVYVLLEADQATTEHSPDTDQTAARSPSDNDALISQMRDEIAYLREENRRKDHIIAGLVERIPPAIEAPGAQQPTAEASEGMEPRSATAGPQTAAERPFTEEEPDQRGWFRRFFGF
jgi:excisionase family DNA binding protein